MEILAYVFIAFVYVSLAIIALWAIGTIYWWLMGDIIIRKIENWRRKGEADNE